MSAGTMLTPVGPDVDVCVCVCVCVSGGTFTYSCLSQTHPIQLALPRPLEGEISRDLPQRTVRYVIYTERVIFQIRIEMYIQSCT